MADTYLSFGFGLNCVEENEGQAMRGGGDGKESFRWLGGKGSFGWLGVELARLCWRIEDRVSAEGGACLLSFPPLCSRRADWARLLPPVDFDSGFDEGGGGGRERGSSGSSKSSG